MRFLLGIFFLLLTAGAFTSFVALGAGIGQLIASLVLGGCAYLCFRPSKGDQLAAQKHQQELDLRATAERRYEALAATSVQKPLISVHAGGSGYPLLNAGATYYLCCRATTLAIADTLTDAEVEIPLNELLAVEITGPGKETTNAGVVGGGFGLEGAIKGALIASAINAATTRSTTNTFLRVATNSAEAHFHLNNVEPAELRMLLSHLVVAAEANRLGQQSPRASSSIAEEIKALHKLKDEGLLSEAELSAAKSKLLS